MCLTYMCVYGVWSHGFVYIGFYVCMKIHIHIHTHRWCKCTYIHTQVPAYIHMSMEVNTYLFMSVHTST